MNRSISIFSSFIKIKFSSGKVKNFIKKNKTITVSFKSINHQLEARKNETYEFIKTDCSFAFAAYTK